MFEDFRLKVFSELAAQGSFTAAARKLGISQPAVSQNIAEIESNYGIRLFDRSRKSVELTREGKVFLSYAKNILDRYAELDTIFRNFQSISKVQYIRVSVSSDALAEVSATLLPYLNGICPGICVQIVADSAETADLAVSGRGRLRQVSASESFAAHPLWPLVRNFLCSEDN